jgi:hypothetical protein
LVLLDLRVEVTNMKVLLAAAFTVVPVSTTSAEYSLFAELVGYFNKRAEIACDGQQNCLRAAGSLGWFLWKNREKADLQYTAMKCVGYSAVRRGYVWSPMNALENASSVEVIDIAIEVCDCVIGYWGREPICRSALVEGNYDQLSNVFDQH